MRTFLYILAALLGDINAVRRGYIVRRIRNRIVGRLASRILWRRR